MSDDRIRAILELAEGADVTDEHRVQVLDKLDASNQELEAQAAALVKPMEAKDLPALGAMLAEGKLPGRVILAEADHAALQTQAARAAELEKGAEGMAAVTKEEHAELVRKANAGEQAAKQLAEMKVDNMLGGHMQRGALSAKGLEGIKAKALADFELVDGLLSEIPANAVVPMGEVGSSEAGEASDYETVQKFIDGKISGTVTFSDACRLAVTEFGEEKFNTWNNRPVEA